MTLALIFSALLGTFDADLSALLARLGAPGGVHPLCKERVAFHLDRLAKKPNLRAAWERRKQRWPVIQRALAAAGLPEEFGYVAWVESSFNPEARSPLGSLGVWQFIPGTARRFGLTVDGARDDRLDFEKETRAAAAYLTKLVDEFGRDAPLVAMASYNMGEQRMREALAGRKSDFWELYEKRRLTEEAAEYVPQILAAALIGSNPGRYGLE